MDFTEVAAAWSGCRTDEQKRGLIARLTGVEPGWFDACSSWTNDGPSPYRQEIEALLAFLGDEDKFKHSIAQAHLRCARLALNAQWTAASAPVLTDDLREIAKETGISLGSARDLTEALLPEALQNIRRAADRTQNALCPLVWKDEAGRPKPVLAQLKSERLPNGGGDVFIAAESLFIYMDDAFRAIFTHAPTALKAQGLCTPTGNVRVHLEAYEPYDQRLLTQHGLEGSSAGGALALGLWSLWTGTPLESRVVTSFSLTDKDSPEPDGNCHPIGGDITKAIAVVKHGMRPFLVAQRQTEDLSEQAKALGLPVERAATLAQAVAIVSRVGKYIQRRREYLDSEEGEHPYTPVGGRIYLQNLWLRWERPGEAVSEREQLTDLRELIQRQGNFVMVGEPGAGKTLSLQAIERLTFEDYLENRIHRVPVFLALEDMPNGREPLRLLKRFVLEKAPELKEVFDDYLHTGRIIFLCDALNEIVQTPSFGKKMKHLEAWIRQFGEADPTDGHPHVPATKGVTVHGNKCKFIFTCRTENYQSSLPTKQVVEVDRLTDAVIEEMSQRLLEAKGRASDTESFLATLRRLDVWEMCRNPMMLGMVLDLYAYRLRQAQEKEDGTGGRQPVELPVTPGALFAEMSDMLFDREESHATRRGVTKKKVKSGLQALAFTMLERGLRGTKVKRTDVQTWMTPALSKRDPQAQADLVVDAAQRLLFIKQERQGPLRNVPHPRDLFEYRHQKWQEFWAALQINEEQTPAGNRLTVADWRNFLVKFWWESEMPNRSKSKVEEFAPLPPLPPTGWEEVIHLLAGFHPRADELVRYLMKVNPVMAARCIHEGRAQVSEHTRLEVISKLLDILNNGCPDPSDPQKDIALRVRIAAGTLLGHLGDPRFDFRDETGNVITDDERRARVWRGEEDGLILPAMVDMPPGRF